LFTLNAISEPALILEDDVLLSKYTPKLLADLADKKKCELISLENRNRKKFVAKTLLMGFWIA
jgi:glycosyl transferase family 25